MDTPFLGTRASGPHSIMRSILIFALALSLISGDIPAAPSWSGIWSFDLCHEDRKGDHEAGSYCRQGVDRIVVALEASGRVDIQRCPSDPWGESRVSLDSSGRTLRFTTVDGLEMRLTLADDGASWKGTFRSSDGHSGRAWGRRAAGCG